jgi:branched-chain amino acid transport system permease protein
VKTPRLGLFVGLAAALLAVMLPFIGLHVLWILPGAVDVVNSAGTLEVLALCFIFAGMALGYDVMFGHTGLLSLGVVLHFAAGVYVFDIALTVWHWPLASALLLTVGVALVVGLVVGAVALRVSGIAFTMVTLAFAQAFYYLIEDNPHGLTGGDDGLTLLSSRLPGFLSGAVSNTRSLYWIALGFLVVVGAVVWIVTESSTGHVLIAIRDNERRVEVLGLRPFGFKLAAYTLSSLIASGAGVIYVLLIGTAVPSAVATTTVTLSIVVMVVLGGAASRWGVVTGGIVYIYLQQYLVKVAAEPTFASLPGFLRVPLSQPQFLLGALFVLFVMFVPGGLAGALLKLRLALKTSRTRDLEEAMR